MRNILIEHTRTEKMKHCMVKLFIPVFKRVVEKETWLSNRLGNLRYIRWGSNFYQATPTSIPKKTWPIIRVRVRRTGQLSLWN